MVDSMRTTGNKSGFALLVSLIVVTVVISIGLAVLDLTIKQVRLSATTKDSEVAFHAANAGLECARYLRRDYNDDIIAGNTLTDITCFGQAFTSPTATVVALVDDSDGQAAWHYEYEFTWGPSNDRCTSVDMVVVVAPAFGDDADVTSATMASFIPGYPSSGTITCPQGSQCTTISVRGYNQPCSSGSFAPGVIERQVLLEF